MTLNEWCKKNNINLINNPRSPGSVSLAIPDEHTVNWRDLYHLEDYYVSTRSGPVFYFIERLTRKAGRKYVRTAVKEFLDGRGGGSVLSWLSLIIHAGKDATTDYDKGRYDEAVHMHGVLSALCAEPEESLVRSK